MAKYLESESNMEWYWWALIGWVVSGLVALGMDMRDNPAMRENIGWAEVWPVLFGPLWLMLKLWHWFLAWGKR